jgi:glycosyltransferase involved in cell wall biosynthesis
VDTIAWLVSRGHDLRYTWVGEGPLDQEVRDRVDRYGLADRVVLHGAVQPGEVMALLGTASLFFVPTRQENFFTAAAEAICAGRPVVLPRNGGYVEYCDERNSVLVDACEVHALGAAIVDALTRFADTDPATISASVSPTFSTPVVGARFLDLYRELVRRP